jgi:hypothetical protein
MRISPMQKEGLVKRLKNVGGIIYAVEFCTSQESIDDMEQMWVRDDCKCAVLFWISIVGFVPPNFGPNLTFDEGQKKGENRIRELSADGWKW